MITELLAADYDKFGECEIEGEDAMRPLTSNLCVGTYVWGSFDIDWYQGHIIACSGGTISVEYADNDIQEYSWAAAT